MAKKHKLSEDVISDSDTEENPKETPTPTSMDSFQRNSDGEIYFELTSRRRVTVRRWKTSTLIDIREFWGDDGDLKPGKKGISLTLDQWKQLLKWTPEIEASIAKLDSS
ncbi:hypothetical protein PSACC_02103 [Paramicrosporidium saccamoebae]|uniref:Transcriptional coactivator p15 (PC4) C-terminal domain-containing protein n=1 Tax=Paramicrosporidium saccamoebae TaxID=1246581 RepID=A0A2H9TJZ2_9FUNG|nr:hypothetical protein PSACC_02103 [Paramicrosporidium saccamoebae]